MRRGTKDKLFSRILEEIERSDGEVALSLAGFAIVKVPSVDVTLGVDGRIGV